MKQISILYVCNEDRATTKQRLMALADLSVKVDIVYTYRLDEKINLFRKLSRSVKFRLGYFPERNKENEKILDHLYRNNYDILFIEKGLSIKPKTINKAKKLRPRIRIISYSLDDVMNKRNSSVYYQRSIPLYDFHFTNKKYNVPELENAGGKNVHYFINGYSVQVHHPETVTPTEMEYYGSDVAFIGTYEKERADLIRWLAENGIRIKIWGWIKNAGASEMVHPGITVHEACIYDDAYRKVISSSKINLCFLRKENRDTETTRSVEIPACGGFMIAERTSDHLRLFKEDEEAVYFDSKEELLEKINYYLNHEEERKVISINVRQRCITSKYSYTNQLKIIISIILGYEAFSDN